MTPELFAALKASAAQIMMRMMKLFLMPLQDIFSATKGCRAHFKITATDSLSTLPQFPGVHIVILRRKFFIYLQICCRNLILKVFFF